MSLDFPQLSASKASTREQIILLLSQEWPLGVKEVHSRLERQGVSVSYQAVHKAVQELVDDRIVEKVDGCFLLSKAWIESNSSFFNGLNLKYARAPLESTLVFNSLFEVDRFLVDFCKKSLAGKKKPVVCFYWNHFWIPLLLSKSEYVEMKALALVSDSYSVTPGKTALDRYCASFWKKNNMKVKIGVKPASFSDLLVFENVVVQVFYPKSIRGDLDSFFSRTKKITDLSLEVFFEKLFEKPVKIPVVITVNKGLAEELKQRILDYF